MSIVFSGQDGVVERARKQLENLVSVWAILDYTETRTFARAAPEQHNCSVQRTKQAQRGMALAHKFEHSEHGDPIHSFSPERPNPAPLIPSEALQMVISIFS
ncbi:hypothetical protein EW146_g9287 [Bondarzewia mesenterica]|uniref:Uncharacterized protein n=1 Tax=Bondarzewia mesenterica TaxID=1095465 RepID=A0A4S4L7J3_9AGAM|nr:hypothetical protein EW146_g9287 [Bondarzewia mesenterica]